MISVSSYRIDVLDAFEALRMALYAFKKVFCNPEEKKLPGWFEAPAQLLSPVNSNSREKAFAFFNQLEYLNNQDPREILIGQGVFAASESVLKAIEAVNACKNQFKRAVLALKEVKGSLSDDEFTRFFEKALGKRPPALSNSFRKMGFARLHLKQCYRLIPCLPERPAEVSWTWAHTKAIKRISVFDAEQLLIKQGRDSGIERQLSKLYTLSSEEPLAIVRELAPHLRTNVVFRKGKDAERLMMKGTVPLFYPSIEGEMLPALYPAFEKQERDEERVVRSDVKLASTPFLQAIHAHRYL